MKKILSVLSLIVLMFSINSYAGIGEGVSSVGTLSSFNNTNTIIITHGYTHNGNFQPIPESQWRHYVWQFAMAYGISNNSDIYLIRKGLIYKINESLDDLQARTLYGLNNSMDDLLGQPIQFIPQTNKDNVFIFDWTLESAINKHGFAEGAADVLASTLVELGRVYPFILEHLHFIGYSRGCVVNSEAIQRLIYWASEGLLPSGLNIDPNIHMTTLDPHPAGHWTWWYPWSGVAVAMDDDDVNDWGFLSFPIGVTGWKGESSKVSFIDNHYQTWLFSGFRGLSDYPGLNNESDIANNYLTDKLSQSITSAHNLVHTWYHGTVSSIAQNDSFDVGIPNIDRSTQWYNTDLGKTEGFYLSLNRPGNPNELFSIESELKDVTLDNKYGLEKLIFNGDFVKGSTAISYWDSLPGWSYQGGVSSARADLFNPSARISDEHRTLIHNSFFIPTNASRIVYRIQSLEAHPYTQSDELKVYLNDNLRKTSEVIGISYNNYEWAEFSIPDNYKGKMAQLKFQLIKNQTAHSSLKIDDVSFEYSTNFRSTVACPVDFNIYDNLGNHTGPINDSTYVEEIPGSDYYVYEDSTGDKIKTVYLKPLEGNANYTFVIESRDTTSSFTYEIEDYSDTTKGTVSYQFNNIAIQPNTVSTCSLDVNVQIPVLLVDVDGDGNTDSTYNPAVITAVGNNESTTQSLPTQYELFNCFPNPFNPSTSISYSIPEVSNVTLKVYDILGNEIATLVNEQKSAGHYTVYFNSKNLSSGIYFYTLQTKTYTATKKMILLK
jgi:hypothetical protein